MKFESTTIKNFLGIGEAVLVYDDKGLVLVEGENKDSSTSASNGSGKSSLFESPCYAYFGVTKRGLKGDEIINRKAGKNCRVEHIFIRGPFRYQIIRTRKDAELGTTLKFSVWAKDEDKWADLTKGTIKETQALIEETIGVSQLTFLKTVYFGQDDVKPFASLTDSELKQVFEQAMGLTIFSENALVVKGYIGGIDSRIAEIDRGIKSIGEDIGLKFVRCDGLIENIKDLEEHMAEMFARVDHDRETFMDEIGTIGGLNLTAKEELEAKSAALIPTAKKLVELQTLLNNLKIANGDKASERAGYKARMSLSTAAIKSLVNTLGNLPAKVGKDCGECGRVFTSGDIERLGAATKATLEAAKFGYDVLNQETEKTTVKITEYASLEAKLQAKIDELNVQVKDFDAFKSTCVAESTFRNARLEELSKKIERLDSEVETMAPAKLEAAKEELAALEKEMHSLRAAMDAKTDELLAAKSDKDLAEMLAEILGNGGIKSYVFDSITPALNVAINEFMNILDPDILVDVSTISKLKSGELREKFGISVDNKNGAALYDGNSGGERQKVNLAVALAFNKITRSMCEEDIPILVLDEPMESLDSVSAERALDILLTLDTKNVFLITHNQTLRDLIPNRMMIEKSGGTATLRRAA
jgi:DNA repair exonuclease SbcCD ATPase subunit